MELEERSIEENLERRCAVCGATLTEQEIHEARETAGPFLCSVHAAETAPAEEAGVDVGDADEPL